MKSIAIDDIINQVGLILEFYLSYCTKCVKDLFFKLIMLVNLSNKISPL